MLLLETQHEHKVLLKEGVNWVEYAREGYISDQWYFQTSEEATKSFLVDNLSKGICNAAVFWEANDFKTSFYDN